MRSLKKNMVSLKYSLYSNKITVYEKDIYGNTVYVIVDGVQVPIISSEIAGYRTPVSFKANLSMSGGEAEAKEYGVSVSEYEAIIVTTDKSLHIDEKTIIWSSSEPMINNDGTIDRDSADWEVICVKPSLNQMKYLLKRV